MRDYPDYIVGDVYVVTALIGGCAKAGDEWILPEGKTLPSEKEIDLKREELKADYDSKQYQRNRAVAYDPIPEQLDQIYHDMDGWKKRIKAVKDKYPKP